MTSLLVTRLKSINKQKSLLVQVEGFETRLTHPQHMRMDQKLLTQRAPQFFIFRSMAVNSIWCWIYDGFTRRSENLVSFAWNVNAISNVRA